MKLSIAFLSIALATASAGRVSRSVDLSTNLAADSEAGMKLLSQARRVEQEEEEVDFTWVSGYSLKFQGCHQINQWNGEADGRDEPKIQTTRLVRFRLCPSNSCTYENASGCSGGYGDYIIELGIFLQAYWQNKMQMEEWNCEYTRNYECGCENEDYEDSCEYACFMDRNMDYCWEGGDPDVDDDDDGNDEEEFNAEEYLECGGADFANNNRRLEDADGQEVEYFIGPYCADAGDEIFLGVFTDESCTNTIVSEEDGDAEYENDYGASFYYETTGKMLPYSQESLVSMGCISCMEPDDPEMQDNGNDYQDEDMVIEMCEQLYEQAGKCESSLDIKYPNENACTYMEGIKIIRADGQVISKRVSNSTANIVIASFCAVLILLGAYVYHLKTRLDRAKVNLTD